MPDTQLALVNNSAQLIQNQYRNNNVMKQTWKLWWTDNNNYVVPTRNKKMLHILYLKKPFIVHLLNNLAYNAFW